MTARLVSIIKHATGPGWALSLLWVAAVLAAALLLFRPHEDIHGGEDPGAYINSGITHGRQLVFFYVDPLLSQVPADIRPLFFYGHSGYGTTKDACLWVHDTGKALIGPHFQPAYPLLISMASRLFGSFAALYVVPLFAILAGLALAALATECIEHRWSGMAAFTFWILNPLVLWHGRCPRPEIIAAFMFFGGAALLLNAWNNAESRTGRDIILGALCIGFAPFFHVTAWLLVIPAAIVIIFATLTGRKDYIVAPIAWIIPAAALVYQSRNVTNYYGIYHFISLPLRHPFISATLFAACAISIAGIAILTRRRLNRTSVELPLALGGALAVTTILFLIVSYFTRDVDGSIPILGRPVHHYLYLSDLKAFANMLSKPMTALIIAGWAAWLTGRSRFRRTRALVALVVFPGLMLAGNIHDFMMTRYFIVTAIPVSALSMAALVTLTPNRRYGSALAGLLALIIGLAGLNNRRHLVTLVEHEGFADFLRPFAQTILADNGMLLCEYSRFAAPFEHFFGIPALGLDNQQHDDYSEQERAWATIMRNNPEKPAFFITPFQQPSSIHFDFILERTANFQDRSLQQAYNNLPTQVRQGPLPLTMYRMSLKTGESAKREITQPHVITMDAGNMGLRRFSTVRVRTRSISGLKWKAGERISFDLPAQQSVPMELLLIIMTDEPYPAAPLVEGVNEPDAKLIHLADNWLLLRLRPSLLNGRRQVCLESLNPMFLADAVLRSEGNAASLMPQIPGERIEETTMLPFKARWARAEAEAVIPVPQSMEGLLLMLIEAPDIRNGKPAELTISSGAAFAPIESRLETGRWHWQFGPFRFENAFKANSAYMRLSTSPAWDSGLDGFPADLGILVGYIILIE